MSRRFLDSDSINVPSCIDLGGCNCEGWLWLKKHVFVPRWCVLINNVLKIILNKKNEDVENSISILNSTISQIKKSRSSNWYFKIMFDNVTYTFGTSSMSDYLKWLNKLNLTAAGIKINETDGPVGAFTSGYILEPRSSLIMNGGFTENQETKEYNSNEGNDRTISNLINASNHNLSLKIDQRLEIYFDRSLSTPHMSKMSSTIKSNYTLIQDDSSIKMQFRGSSCKKNNTNDQNKPPPIAPPRKKSITKNTNYTPSSGDNFKNNDVKRAVSENEITIERQNIDFTKLNSVIEGNDNFKNSGLELRISHHKDSKMPFDKTFTASNETENISVENEFLSSSDKVSSQSRKSYIDSIKEIAELERLIRTKSQMVLKIDDLLKSQHLSTAIQEYWDEWGEEIIKIVS